MSHQGQYVAQSEAELRWQFTHRYSLVGFMGIANAWNDGDDDSRGTVVAGGIGFRYELARRYGLHGGLDLAFGPEDPAIYITVGSAWMRP
jgi:hypothetical protein